MPRTRAPLAGLVVAAALAWPSATAQHVHRASPGPLGGLLPGMGALHFPITTASPQAQKLFDQGLTLIYAFNHDEAARSFRRAAQLDPKAAMPHWGIALAIGPNYNDTAVSEDRAKATWEAIEKAKSLASGASERERGYIDALAKRFAADGNSDWPRLWMSYSEVMGELSRRFPDDPDATTLYAESLMMLKPWQLWKADGTPADGTLELVSILERVLKQHPDHVGANHLYVHAVEASKNPERALASARRLEALVPSGGHLVHMPGHIYMRLGDHEAAARINERAAAADRQYMRFSRVREGMYPAMYYSHNLHFIAVGYAEAGNYAKAIAGARMLVDNIWLHLAAMPMLEFYLAVPRFVMLRSNRWDAILAEKGPDPSLAIDSSFYHYARALALLRKKDRKGAEAERSAFNDARGKISGDAPFGLNTSAAVVGVAASVLDARVAESDGDTKAALDHWCKAVEAQDALNYDEPPPWYYPIRESLGGALLRSGDTKAAEKVFREDLDHNPRSPRSLFGLAAALKAQERDVEAALVERQLRETWKGPAGALQIEDL